MKGQSGKVAMHACTQRGILRSRASPLSGRAKRRTCGICEPEGDGLVFDVAHVADGHLARVVGKVFGSEVLDLQHLGFTLRGRNTAECVWLHLPGDQVAFAMCQQEPQQEELLYIQN